MKNIFLCLLFAILSMACRTTRPTETLIVPPLEYTGYVAVSPDTIADNAVIDTLLLKLDTLSTPTKDVIRQEVRKVLAKRPRLTKPILLDTLGMKVEVLQVGDSLKLSMVREAYEVKVPVWKDEKPNPAWYEKLPLGKWWFWLPVAVTGLWLFFLVRLIIGMFQKR